MIRPRILLVEDDQIFAIFIKRLLNDNYDIIQVVRTGEDAYNYVQNDNSIDLIIMDIEIIGELDGVETAEKIKTIADIPIIYLTNLIAESNKQLIERIKKTKPSGILKKHTNLNELAIIIDVAINKRKLEIENQKKQSEIEDNEEKFHTIVDLARDAIIITNSYGIITIWNKAATQIFGFSDIEAIGEDINKLLELNHLDNISIDDKAKITNNTIEMLATCKDGSQIPIEISLSSFKLKEQWYNSSIIREISERKRNELEMKKLIEELSVSKDAIENNANEMILLTEKLYQSELDLKEMNASKDKFFSIISHDLKGPFQALLGNSEILTNDIGELSREEIAEFANDLHISAQQVFKLLENLLEWSRLQRGVIDYNPQEFSLYQLVDYSINILHPAAKYKNIEIINNTNIDITVYADLNMTNTVIRNLISNAIKFTNVQGKININSSVVDNNKIAISIADSGIGISEENLKKLFKIDVHFTSFGTMEEKGTGLGLILCKELTEKMGGEIKVDSILGLGSTFTISLPLANQ